MKKHLLTLALLSGLFFSFSACKKDPPPTISFEDKSTRFKAIVTDSLGKPLTGAFVVLYDGLGNLTSLSVASDAAATNDKGEAIFSNLDATHSYFFISHKGYSDTHAYTVFYPNADWNNWVVPTLTEGAVTERTQVIKLKKNS